MTLQDVNDAAATHSTRTGVTTAHPTMRPFALLRLSALGFALMAFSAIGGAGCDCGQAPVDGGSPEAEPEACTEGTADCACDADGECATDLACTNDLCEACVWGSDGCPCNEGNCTGDAICDQTDDVCRPTTVCEDAGCAQFQLCDDSGQDAVCLDDCEAGYDWNGINCTATPSCTEGDPGFFDCGENRECDVVGGAVECGDCINGTVDVNGDCLENDCDAICGEGRTCSDNVDGGPPVCGECDPSYIEDDAGNCIDRVTCADLIDTNPCDSDEVCLEATADADARCAEQSNCDEGFVASPVNNSCSQCVNCYDFGTGSPVPLDGVIGVGNNGFSAQETCVCELAEGFFQSQDDGKVKECDADNDGWVNADLEEILDSENAFANEQRCTIRRVSGFELRSDDFIAYEFGGSPTLAPSRLVSIDEIQVKFGLPDTGIRVDPNNVKYIELFEREELDIDGEFADRYDSDLDLEKLYEYGVQRATGVPDVDAGPGGADGGSTGGSDGGTTGSDAGPSGNIAALPGRLLAAEANSLTKMCNHSRDDLNRDGVADVDQGHGNVPSNASIVDGPGIPDAIGVYYRMAYFIELNRGFFVSNGCGDGPDCHGTYVIQEKSRMDLGTETGLSFDYTAAESGYWQMCSRSRDSAFVGTTDPQNRLDNNFDFADWHTSCATETGLCATQDGRLHYDGRPLNTVGDIDNPAPDLDNGAARFPGMNHHSMFKCVTFQNTHASAPNGPALANRAAPTDYVLQDCAINPHTARPVPGELATNPLDPTLTCASVDAADAASQRNLNIEQNFFVAVKQTTYDNDANPVPAETGYQRGCIEEGQEWDRFCIVDSELQRGANFGELFCGCGPNRTGVNCEIGCPDDNLFSNRLPLDGELVGYWMCARPTASEVETLTGTDGSTTYTLRGEVPAVVTPTEPLCEESDGGPNCDVGYSIHPYTIR